MQLCPTGAINVQPGDHFAPSTGSMIYCDLSTSATHSRRETLTTPKGDRTPSMHSPADHSVALCAASLFQDL